MGANREPSPADQMRAIVENYRDRRIGELCGIHLFEDRIIKLPRWANRRTSPDAQWIVGVSARVDNGGRMTSNSVFAPAFGVAGGRTRSKPSELWIVIDGPEFQWQVRLPPRHSRRARKFVEMVNTVSRLANSSAGAP